MHLWYGNINAIILDIKMSVAYQTMLFIASVTITKFSYLLQLGTWDHGILSYL